MINTSNKFEQVREAKATGIFLKGSPRKFGLVAKMVIGLGVNEALTQLSFSKKRCARVIRKVLFSAIANAQNNYNIDIDSLSVSQILVGKSRFLRRMHPRARGRGATIHKRYTNITVVVA